MTFWPEDLPACSSCGGKTVPLILCDTCGAASILRDARQLEWAAACPECGTFNAWQLICEQCHSRFPAPGASADPDKDVPTPPPSPAPTLSLPPNERPKRRIRSEYDARAVEEMLRILGVDAARARALIDRGYNAIWKIARAPEAELARIPEVGPVAARKITASLHLLNYQPPQRTKEQIEQDEYECPLCRCLTSAFSPACLECGTTFDEEEMDESIRKELDAEGFEALLSFYNRKIEEVPSNADFWYARGLLFESIGRADEAIASLDEAARLAPDAKKYKVAQLRLRARLAQAPQGAEQLRSTARSLVDDAAWEQEVAELDHLITNVGVECARCGAPLPKDATACPSCGNPVGAPGPEATQEAPPSQENVELDLLVDDLLVGELEESLTPEELERTKAAVLDWLIEELEASMGSDALTEFPVKKRAAQKPAEPSPMASSVGFISSWMRGSKGLVSGLGPKRPRRGKAGKVNGLVNGSGRVNGLVNGVGRVNGLVNGVGRVNGLVNGTGRVNGLVQGQGRVNGLVSPQGRVNGSALVPGAQLKVRSRRTRRSRRVRYGLIAAGVLVALVIGTSLFAPTPTPYSPIVIDGVFSDWASVPALDAASPAPDPNVSISRYAALLDRDSLFLYASASGSTFGDSAGYDGFYFLIDADGNPSTGFAFRDLGADAVVEVFGGNNSVAGARLYVFPADAELNWSRRQSSGRVVAAASALGLEAEISTFDIGRFDSDAYRIEVYTTNFQGATSRGAAPLSPFGGAVLLEPRPLTAVIGSAPSSFVEIRVRALGISAADTWTVSSFLFNTTPGITTSLSAESVTLSQGRPTDTIIVSVAAPGLSPGDVIEVRVIGAQAPRPVVVRGEPARAYVIAPPADIRIDGLFVDWLFVDTLDTDAAPINNADVDIVRAGAAVNTSISFFHVAVSGVLLDGTVPERHIRVPPSPGGNGSSGPPVPLPRQTGEDILRVYVDVNASDTAGEPVGGVYADYLLEVRGQAGRITSRTLFAWTGRWSTVSNPGVMIAKTATDIEGSISILATSQTQMVFAATDWSGLGDVTAPVNATVLTPALAQQVAGGPQINAPEFHEVAAPVAGTLAIVLVFLRRRRREG